MDGCLALKPKPPWDTVSKQSIYGILKTIFHTLTVAMRYEPANAKFFETEVVFEIKFETDIPGNVSFVVQRSTGRV
jgi:hypothetical protein